MWEPGKALSVRVKRSRNTDVETQCIGAMTERRSRRAGKRPSGSQQTRLARFIRRTNASSDSDGLLVYHCGSHAAASSRMCTAVTLVDAVGEGFEVLLEQ